MRMDTVDLDVVASADGGTDDQAAAAASGGTKSKSAKAGIEAAVVVLQPPQPRAADKDHASLAAREAARAATLQCMCTDKPFAHVGGLNKHKKKACKDPFIVAQRKVLEIAQKDMYQNPPLGGFTSTGAPASRLLRADDLAKFMTSKFGHAAKSAVLYIEKNASCFLLIC